MKAIRRDFSPADLREEIERAGINGVVSVQVRQTVEETRWLLELAAANTSIRGVVGWVPLTDPAVREVLENFAASPALRGVRHILQGEPAEYMLRDDFNAGVAALGDFDLAYDILIYERQLPQAIQFVDRHPNQTFVLDHIAKPRIREGVLSPWREQIADFAKRENVWCKISGLVTEADFQKWTEEDLRPYVETVLGAFGPKRLMFGSDWPVCEVACPYSRWVGIVKRFLEKLSPNEQDEILGGVAARVYGLAAP